MADIYGQLVKAQAENLSSDPGTTPTGLFWCRTDTNDLKFYDGGAVRKVATLDGTQTLTNKSISASQVNSGQLAIAQGGTSQATAATAFAVLAQYSAKGDLPGYSGSVAAILAVGADGTILTADAASTNGFKWGNAALSSTLNQFNVFIGNSSNLATASNTALLGDISGTTTSQSYAVTNATPGVFTANSHGFTTGDKAYVTVTQNGFTANTTYYVHVINSNTFHLSTTLANAVAGTVLASSGSTAGVIVGGGLVLTSGVKGIQTNTSATAGYVGELKSSTTTRGSPVILATGTGLSTVADITTLVLTPGDWNIWADFGLYATASGTGSVVNAGLNTSTALPSATSTGYYSLALTSSALDFGTADFVNNIPMFQVKVAAGATTTYHLVARANLASISGNFDGYGTIWARRMS